MESMGLRRTRRTSAALLKSLCRSGRSALPAALLVALPAFVLGLERSTPAARVAGDQGPNQSLKRSVVPDGGPGNDVAATAVRAAQRPATGGREADEIKTIDVVASQFRFDPMTISVAQGDTVRLRLRSADRAHSFAIKAFRVKALIPKGGEAIAVDFVADRAGTFDFTCAEYCGTGHGGMKGKLVVVPRGE